MLISKVLCTPWFYNGKADLAGLYKIVPVPPLKCVLKIQGVTVMAVDIVNQYSYVYTWLRKETNRREETNNCGLKTSTFPSFAGGTLCGLGKDTGGFYQQETRNLFSNKQPDTYLGYFSLNFFTCLFNFENTICL